MFFSNYFSLVNGMVVTLKLFNLLFIFTILFTHTPREIYFVRRWEHFVCYVTTCSLSRAFFKDFFDARKLWGEIRHEVNIGRKSKEAHSDEMDDG